MIGKKILDVYALFHSLEEYKRTLECDISNHKINMREIAQRILEMVGANIHSRICHLFLTKQIYFFQQETVYFILDS